MSQADAKRFHGAEIVKPDEAKAIPTTAGTMDDVQWDKLADAKRAAEDAIASIVAVFSRDTGLTVRRVRFDALLPLIEGDSEVPLPIPLKVKKPGDVTAALRFRTIGGQMQLCDRQGTPLPGQLEISVSNDITLGRGTVAFLIDGKKVVVG